MSGKEQLKVYSQEELKEKLKELSHWTFEEGYLVREYLTKSWKETIFLLNSIAGIAEAYWHHPDMEVSFKRLKVKLITHEAGGITDRDLALAGEIEKISSLLLKR